MDATAVLVAPWVEEAAKGAAVLLVLLFRRREFDGVVDGIVLAGLAGGRASPSPRTSSTSAGRSWPARSRASPSGFFAAGFTFVLRGVLSPFAHPLFTAMIGIGLGIAARTAEPGDPAGWRRWPATCSPSCCTAPGTCRRCPGCPGSSPATC